MNRRNVIKAAIGAAVVPAVALPAGLDSEKRDLMVRMAQLPRADHLDVVLLSMAYPNRHRRIDALLAEGKSVHETRAIVHEDIDRELRARK
jgi:hypothetical protein